VPGQREDQERLPVSATVTRSSFVLKGLVIGRCVAREPVYKLIGTTGSWARLTSAS
jgi:hypothetical protein